MWEPSLGAETQKPMPLKNDLQAGTFQSYMSLSMQESGKAIFLGGRKGSPREWIFRPLSHSKCLAPQTPDFQAWSEGLNSQVRALCPPALSELCKHIPRSVWSYPWERRLKECV